jgi:ABC-2 type transport system permease protein
MRTIFILVGNEIRRFRSDKTAMSLTFFVPFVLIYIFGNVFGVGRPGGPAPTGIPLAIVNQSDSPFGTAVTAALQKEAAFKVITTQKDPAGQEQPLTEAGLREMIGGGSIRFGLIFPPDAAGDQLAGLKLKFLNNPRNDIETQTVTGLLQKTLYSSAPQALIVGVQKAGANFIGPESFESFSRSLADAIAGSFGGDPQQVYDNIKSGQLNFGATLTDAASGRVQSFVENLIKIESEQVGGGKVKSPMATRSVGGWAMMFLLFSLSASANSLFDEKKAGLFQRLLSAPVRRTHILWSKYLFGMLLGFVQLTMMFLAGRLLFGIDILSNLGNLLLICLAASTACVAFGMLLAAVAPSSSAASGLGTLLILIMSAIGGAWFPTSFMPEFVQQFSRLSIVYWAIDGFLKVLWANCTTLELLPTLAVLFGIAAVVNTFSVWRFKRGNIFH